MNNIQIQKHFRRRIWTTKKLSAVQIFQLNLIKTPNNVVVCKPNIFSVGIDGFVCPDGETIGPHGQVEKFFLINIFVRLPILFYFLAPSASKFSTPNVLSKIYNLLFFKRHTWIGLSERTSFWSPCFKMCITRWWSWWLVSHYITI